MTPKPKTNYLEVAERIYRHVNPESKMCCPNTAYILTQKWYHEWMETDTNLDLFNWCIENKSSKTPPQKEDK